MHLGVRFAYTENTGGGWIRHRQIGLFLPDSFFVLDLISRPFAFLISSVQGNKKTRTENEICLTRRSVPPNNMGLPKYDENDFLASFLSSLQ